MFLSSDLSKWTDGRWTSAAPIRIREFHFDTRKLGVGKEVCFLALSGGARDGHDYLAAAQEAGAVAAIVERPDRSCKLPQLVVRNTLTALHAIARAYRQNLPIPVAAITGSYGKTSTKEILASMLGRDLTAATPGNWNNHIGLPLSLLRATIPQHYYVVLEAGISQPGEMATLGRLAQANCVLISGIGPAHLENLGTDANVAEEKYELANAAMTNAPLIFPIACLRYAPFREGKRKAWVIAAEGEGGGPFSPGQRLVTFRARLEGLTGQRIEVHQTGQKCISFLLHSVSSGMAHNAVLAVVAARTFGVEDERIIKGAEEWRPVGDRGSWRKIGNRPYYVDCYNANPTAVADALRAFGRGAPGREPRLIVLGTMLELGPRAVTMHEQVFANADFQFIPDDACIFVGEQKLCEGYAMGAQAAGADPTRIRFYTTTPSSLPDEFGEDTAVFLKGSRSHHLETLLPKDT